MGMFFVYMLKSSVCLALFYLFYRLLLSKETFHRFNRLALLGVLAFSCLLPLVEVALQNPVETEVLLEELMLVPEAEPSVVLEEAPVPFPWKALVLLVYVLGILFFLGRHIWSLARMCRLLRTSRREKMPEGITLFVHNEKVAPFSWMKTIVLSEKDMQESGDAILTHERAHIKNLHSWDLLLAEVCIFFQWFNPAAWLLKQELQTIHEYEADEWVINNGIDAKTYQLLIIKKAVGARLYSIANSFNHSSLKKRITMMIKKKSNPWARLKYLYVLPLAAVAVAAFARPEVSDKLDEISSVKVNDLTSIVKADEVKSVENSSDEKFKVSGVVLKHPGYKPVAGASVMVRGTSHGALTDGNGNFEVEAKKGDVLVVSFVGLQTQLVPIEFDSSSAGNTKLGIGLKEDVQSMEEMVVVGMSPKSENTDVVFDMPLEKVKKTEDSKVKYTEVKVDETEVSQKEGEIFQVVEQMPEFPGGMQKAMEFLGKNIKYPVAAQEAKIEGRVIVQFVVGKDGSISDVQAVRGVSPELDAEAIRVVSMMPNWNPGKQRGQAVSVKYSMPIMFRLQTSQPKAEAAEAPGYLHLNLKVDKDADPAYVDAIKNQIRSMKYPDTSGSLKIHGAVGKSPLIIVDGKVLGYGMHIMNKIPVDQIESISVMKDETAIAQYGEKGKDGVISIITQKNK